MPIIIKHEEGHYRVLHRINGPMSSSVNRWIDGPVFFTDDGRRRIYFVANADDNWAVCECDDLTGDVKMRSQSFISKDRAIAELRSLASSHGWREITEYVEPDFVD